MARRADRTAERGDKRFQLDQSDENGQS
jgi:hypothetical protein